MGWENYHLCHFETGYRRYVPDPTWPDRGMAAAKNVKLAALMDRGICELVYTYDMGGEWPHTITVETVGPGEPDVKYPRFVDGERCWPPEDVGGLPGFELFLDAMANPAHEEHESLRDWYGGPYNPDDIDERFTRRAVAAVAIRRNACLSKEPSAISRRPTGHAYCSEVLRITGAASRPQPRRLDGRS